MRLYLIRHSQPSIAPGICYGSTDLPVAQEMLAHTLTSLLTTLPPTIRLVSSPLRRCADLAVSLRDARVGTVLTLDARLAEMHFGSWELRDWDDIPREEIDAWNADTVSYHPGGGESVLQMAQRIHSFYTDCLAFENDCAVICHAGSIRLMLAAHQGLSPEEMARYAAQNSVKIAYGGMTVLDC